MCVGSPLTIRGVGYRGLRWCWWGGGGVCGMSANHRGLFCPDLMVGGVLGGGLVTLDAVVLEGVALGGVGLGGRCPAVMVGGVLTP